VLEPSHEGCPLPLGQLTLNLTAPDNAFSYESMEGLRLLLKKQTPTSPDK
jgi:hypothetical protein